MPCLFDRNTLKKCLTSKFVRKWIENRDPVDLVSLIFVNNHDISA